jgi:Lrp/AsnC family transcriptional regulator, leucine-responsive regulatory protein
MLVARVADIDDYERLHQNELSRLPGVTRLETSFALREVTASPMLPGLPG